MLRGIFIDLSGLLYVETVIDLFNAIRGEFPSIYEQADEFHVRLFGDVDPEFAYSWFESLANALNAEMSREAEARIHAPLFNYVSSLFATASPSVRNCIDVAFVENLFWQIPHVKCAPYWRQLPSPLQRLYLDFHHREP